MRSQHTQQQANCPLCFPSLMGSLLLTNRQTIILVTYHLSSNSNSSSNSILQSPLINKKAIKRQIGQLRMTSRWKKGAQNQKQDLVSVTAEQSASKTKQKKNQEQNFLHKKVKTRKDNGINDRWHCCHFFNSH